MLSYAAAGFIAGGASQLAGRALPIHAMQGTLRVVAAIATIALGVYLLGFRGLADRIERVGARLWARVSPLTRRFLPVRTVPHAMIFGILWAFVPCGMVYAALVLALGAGSPVGGALTMAAFGLGTLPAMLLTGVLALWLARGSSRTWFRTIAACALLLLGSASLVTTMVPPGVLQIPGIGTTHEHCRPTEQG